jgi:uncharacterized protein YjbJ (UPF0337 family)
MADKDQVTGRLKETEGKVTGDETREAQGKGEKTWGDTKEKARDKWEDVKDKT